MTRNSTKAASSSIWRAIRSWPSPRLAIGSASCRHASMPATTHLLSRLHRKRRPAMDGADANRADRISFLGGTGSGGALRYGPAEERARHLNALAAHHRQIALWAEKRAGNFAHRAALLGAEMRAAGRTRAGCDAASTRRPFGWRGAHGFIQNEAMGNELAARFHAGAGSRDDRPCLSAERPILLSPLGCRGQGPAARSAPPASAPGSRRAR